MLPLGAVPVPTRHIIPDVVVIAHMAPVSDSHVLININGSNIITRVILLKF